MLGFFVFSTFRMDCFAFISKTKVSSRRNGGMLFRFFACETEKPNNKAYSLGLHSQDGGTSSVTNSPGACVSLWV